MSKTISYRLFGAGKVPAQQATTLQGEGLILFDEGIPGSVTYRNFRAPGKFFKWRQQWYSAAIVLTGTRFIAFRGPYKILDVPLQDQRFRGLRFTIENQETLLIAFDASLFHDTWSGTLEYRFKTPHSHGFLNKLREQTP